MRYLENEKELTDKTKQEINIIVDNQLKDSIKWDPNRKFIELEVEICKRLNELGPKLLLDERLDIENKKIFPLFKFMIGSYRFELTWKIRRDKESYKKYVDILVSMFFLQIKLNSMPQKFLAFFLTKTK
jgi:hypothetical protein